MRIENAIYVVEAETKFNLPAGTQFYTVSINIYLKKNKGKMKLKFESLCFVPMCRKLIEPSLLTQKQKDWLNDYHQKCRDKLIPRIKEQGHDDLLTWIDENTQKF